jgi:prolyl-tRNA synthetase
MEFSIKSSLFIPISRCRRGYIKDKVECDCADKSEQRAIELGHCFLLGDRYTKAFNATEPSSETTAEKT